MKFGVDLFLYWVFHIWPLYLKRREEVEGRGGRKKEDARVSSSFAFSFSFAFLSATDMAAGFDPETAVFSLSPRSRGSSTLLPSRPRARLAGGALSH